MPWWDLRKLSRLFIWLDLQVFWLMSLFWTWSLPESITCLSPWSLYSPDPDLTLKRMKKSLMYSLVWILILWPWLFCWIWTGLCFRLDLCFKDWMFWMKFSDWIWWFWLSTVLVLYYVFLASLPQEACGGCHRPTVHTWYFPYSFLGIKSTFLN